MEAPPRSFSVNTPSASMACGRCNTPLTYLGTTPLRTDGGQPTGELGSVFVGHSRLDAHFCPRCGKVELFVDGIGEQFRTEIRAQVPKTAEGTVEVLFRNANILESRGEIEGAVAQYEQLIVRYPGTNYARDCEERLCKIRTKMGI